MHKINIFHIISAHFCTLKNDGASTLSAVDIIIFFGLPLVFAGAMLKFRIAADGEFLPSMLVVFSILFGFLLNVQVLIFSMAKKESSTELKTLVSELFANVSFSILISLICLVLTITMIFLSEVTSWRWSVGTVLFYFSGVLLLNILMIFKRVHVALEMQQR